MRNSACISNALVPLRLVHFCNVSMSCHRTPYHFQCIVTPLGLVHFMQCQHVMAWDPTEVRQRPQAHRAEVLRVQCSCCCSSPGASHGSAATTLLSGRTPSGALMAGELIVLPASFWGNARQCVAPFGATHCRGSCMVRRPITTRRYTVGRRAAWRSRIDRLGRVQTMQGWARARAGLPLSMDCALWPHQAECFNCH